MNQLVGNGANEKFCSNCGAVIHSTAEVCPKCGVGQTPLQYAGTYPSHGTKSKITAGLLAFFLGGLGIHKFYLNQPGWGILYIVFSFTFIPTIVGFIEGIIYLTMSDQAFAAKYH